MSSKFRKAFKGMLATLKAATAYSDFQMKELQAKRTPKGQVLYDRAIKAIAQAEVALSDNP